MAERDQDATQIAAESKWDLRIQRAEFLLEDEEHAAHDLLRFYAEIAKVQRKIYETLHPNIIAPGELPSLERLKDPANLELLKPRLMDLFFIVRMHGPDQLAKRANELVHSAAERIAAVLPAFWQPEQDELDRFFAKAVLQAAAERLADMVTPPEKYESGTCPFCANEPMMGVMRPEGLGAKRSLLCSMCATEWNFPRIKCPSCGEDRNDQLPVYTPEELDYVRVDACETCHAYVKTVDLSKMGIAVPVVDEIASLSLTLWAAEKGYHKLADNILGM